MSEGSVYGFGIASLAVAIVGVALVASGGLLLLPAALVLAVTSIIGWLVRRPRSRKTRAGATVGAVTIVAITGFATYGLLFAG